MRKEGGGLRVRGRRDGHDGRCSGGDGSRGHEDTETGLGRVMSALCGTPERRLGCDPERCCARGSVQGRMFSGSGNRQNGRMAIAGAGKYWQIGRAPGSPQAADSGECPSRERARAVSSSQKRYQREAKQVYHYSRAEYAQRSDITVAENSGWR